MQENAIVQGQGVGNTITCSSRISDRCDGDLMITVEEAKGAEEAFDAGHKYITRKWAMNWGDAVMCPKCLEMAWRLWSDICDAG